MKTSILPGRFIQLLLLLAPSWLLGDVTSAAPPNRPIGLVGITVSSGRVDLHWTDNSANETGFNVERAADIGGLEPGNYGRLGSSPTVPANTSTYADTTVMASKAYWYRVYAVNSDGSSFPSNAVRIVTPKSQPRITLVTPTPADPVIKTGEHSTIAAQTSVPGDTPVSAEYQLVVDNPPGVFDAHDIYATQMDLTILDPRAPSPVADTTPMPDGLPAGAIAEFEIRGTVAAVKAAIGEWQVGNPPLTVYESVTSKPQSTRFVGSREPEIGDAVRIVAYRALRGGPLVARDITYVAPAQPLAKCAVTLSFLHNGTVTSIQSPITDTGYLLSGEIWTIGNAKVRVDAPDFPAYVYEGVDVGIPVTVRFAAARAEANIARQVFVQISKAIQTTTDPSPVFDSTPISLNVPAGTWLYVIVDGVVTGLDVVTGTWVIGDEQIKCYQSAQTLVEPATAGDEVLVYCRRTMTPGPLVAEQINQILPGRLIAPVKGTAVETHLMYNGVVEAMNPNAWTVSGQTFIFDDPEGRTRIDPTPRMSFKVGDLVTVQFEHVGEALPDNGNWLSLTRENSTDTWTDQIELPAVSTDRTGTLFLRVTDTRQYGSVTAVRVAVRAK